MIVSCIIPTYRQWDYLFEALNSVFMQDFAKIELIITDDGSEQFEKDKIEHYILTHKRENIIGYKILMNLKNVGTVKNMNAALAVCSGDIVMPLASDDCFYDSSVVSKVVNDFQKFGCQVLVCSRMRCSKDMKKEYRQMPHPAYLKHIEKQLSNAKQQYMHMALGNIFEYASGSAMYYKAGYIKKRGFYDERYVLWEDGPFVAQTTRAGIKICSDFGVISIRYRDGGISTLNKKVPNKIYYDYCNMIKWEFLEYPERFNFLQKRIILGRYEIQKNFNAPNLRIAIRYPEAIINYYLIMVKKLVMRTGKGKARK